MCSVKNATVISQEVNPLDNADNVVKRKRGRPPKVKPQAKTEAIVQNVETTVVVKPEPNRSEFYLAGFGHGHAVPKPTHQERNRDK